MAGSLATQPEETQKLPNNSHFWTVFNSLESSLRFKPTFLQPFYAILESYLSNGIKIVWLGFEKRSQQ